LQILFNINDRIMLYLSFEKLTMSLVQIEIYFKRLVQIPLSLLLSDPFDLQLLTPEHFFMENLTDLSENDLLEINYFDRWK